MFATSKRCGVGHLRTVRCGEDNQIDFQEFRIHLRGELDEIHLRRMLTDPARVVRFST